MAKKRKNGPTKNGQKSLLRSVFGSLGGFLGVLGASLYWKVVSEFWFGHPKCYFWYPQNGCFCNFRFLAIFSFAYFYVVLQKARAISGVRHSTDSITIDEIVIRWISFPKNGQTFLTSVRNVFPISQKDIHPIMISSIVLKSVLWRGP